MNLSTITVLACGAAFAAVLSAQVMAQGPGPGGGGMGMGQGMGQGGRAGGAAMFEMYDADGDGKITRQEFDAGHEERFEVIDVNKDGSITLEELTVRAKGRNPDRMRQAFQRADKDGNGRLDKTEYDTIADMKFERVDINKDGVVTREEIEEIAVQRRGMGQGMGQGGQQRGQ